MKKQVTAKQAVRPYYGRTLNQITYNGATGETNTLPDLAIPDQVPKLQDLIRRANQGIPQNGSPRNGVFNAQTLDLDKMDELDIVQYRIDLAEQALELKQKQHEAAKAQEQLELRERLLKEVAENANVQPEPEIPVQP